MTVLVTGASGFLGGNLVPRLLREGEQVRALVRSTAKAAPVAALGAEVAVGEVTDRAALASALDGVDAVYHLAGRLFTPGVPEAEYYRTHVEGTRVLLESVGNHPVKRIVYCSTTGVLGVTGNQPASEDAPPAPTNAYEATKWEAEQLVRSSIERGLPAAIVRPGLVYGPGDLHLLGFFRSIQRGLFRPIGAQPVWLHPIFIDDLVEAMWRCGQDQRAIGECFHIAGREPVTLVTLATAIAEALGVDPPSGTIPMLAARLVATAGDLLPGRLKTLAPLTGSRLEFLTNSRVYDVGKSQRLLGFVTRTELGTGIARTADWYWSQGYLSTAGHRTSMERAA